MRFTLNAFIVSTVAVLSLVTPVVNAADPATITTPKSGDTLNTFVPFDVKWYVEKGENPSAVVLSKVINDEYYLQDRRIRHPEY